MQIADRRVAQAQRVDRKIAARLGGEKRSDRLGRRRQCGPAVDPAPVAETGDGRAVGAARVFGTRRAPVLRRGVGGIIKAGDRRRQFDNRLEVEPVPDILWRRAGRQRDEKFSSSGRRRLGQDSRDGRIIRRHHRLPGRRRDKVQQPPSVEAWWQAGLIGVPATGGFLCMLRLPSPLPA
jgi:hypothetical protein